MNKPDIMYYAYLRIKDRKTGELLYWSEDPVIDYGPDWDSQALSRGSGSRSIWPCAA